MKFKNLIYLSLFTGLCISSLFEFSSILSFQYKTENKDLNIKTNILNDYWIVGLENYGLDMAIDLNNCIYVMTPDIYYTELIIIKYTNYGDQLWRFNLEGLRRTSSEITVDSQSNLYLASNYYNQTTDNSMILFKFNSSGNLKWQQTWNEGSAGDIIDIAIDSDDNIYVFGTIYLAKMFKYDLFIIKYNSSGDQQWFYVYEELGREYGGRDMEIDSCGNIVVSGFSLLPDTHFSWIKWFNQSGDLKVNITSNKGGFYSLAVDSLDNVISVNHTTIVKYDNIGNLIWKCNHQIERPHHAEIALDSFNNIYVAASVSIPKDYYDHDLYLIKINSSGSFDWYLTWGGAGEEYLMSMDIDSNDNIYLLSDNYLIKNPEHNGKTLNNKKLWNLYMILFGVCIFISTISLYFILKHRTPKNLRIEIK